MHNALHVCTFSRINIIEVMNISIYTTHLCNISIISKYIFKNPCYRRKNRAMPLQISTHI